MRKRAFAVAVTVMAGTVLAASPAAATEVPVPPGITAGAPVDVATGLVTPLSLVVSDASVTYVAQNFAGTLSRVTADGTMTTLATVAPGDEVGALSYRGNKVFYADNLQAEGKALLMSVPKWGGEPTQVADLGAFEASANPDQAQEYGFVDIPQSCVDQFDTAAPGYIPPVYTGVVDTHPYASVAIRNGVYVADAGANAILRVGYGGQVSTLAVLPAGEPTMLSPELIAGAGFPACAADYPYRFEAVPTDIELGPDGWLYVTTLPGGPEDPSAGERGSVYKVDPLTGDVELVATGLLGATGLAISSTLGVIFVTELYGGPDGTGQISVILPGTGKPIGAIPVNSPAAIELRNGTAYVARDAFVLGEQGPQPVGRITAVPLLGGSTVWGLSEQ